MFMQQNLKLLLPGGALLGALVGLLILAVVSAHPSGSYRINLSCGTHTAAVSGMTFTQDATPVPATPVPVTLSCSASGSQVTSATIPVPWNDWSVQYTCDGGDPTSLVIPATVETGKWYKLDCPSPGGTHGANDPVGGDARVLVTSSVGGFAEREGEGGAPVEAADSSGGSSLPYAAIAGIAAAALAVVAGGGWYTRRRWMR